MAKVKGIFAGKVALVTGGSSGIGLATAKLLSAGGAGVWLMARNRERLQSALSQVEAVRLSSDQRCGLVVADVTDATQVKSAVNEINRTCGAIDILILSAGDVYPCLFGEMDLNEVHSTMEVNYFGAVHVIHACLPEMMAYHRGHIINIASVYGFLGGYGYSAYCASKFALRGFSDALRMELRPLGIQVSIVFPQNTDTPQLAAENRLKTPVMKALDTTRVMPVEEVARAIVRGIVRRQYIIIPGTEGKLLYRLNSLVGSGTYRIMDYLISRAQNKNKRTLKDN